MNKVAIRTLHRILVVKSRNEISGECGTQDRDQK
jgi:hypothetical protein